MTEQKASLQTIKAEVDHPVKAANKPNSEENVSSENGRAKEINGPRGLEPTRYGDWEAKGRCYDF